jgi:hypothetical protein
LTPDQQATVDQQAKSDAQLPTFFSADLKTDVQISRDFEAFLILSTDDLKTSAINWIQQAVTIQKTHKLRDDLVTLAINQELSNSQLRITEFNKQLQDFNSFRQNFQSSSTFSGIPEVQAFLGDLQKVMGELTKGFDRAFFDQTISTVVQKFQDSVGLSTDQLEELQSWTDVLSEYLS